MRRWDGVGTRCVSRARSCCSTAHCADAVSLPWEEWAASSACKPFLRRLTCALAASLLCRGQGLRLSIDVSASAMSKLTQEARNWANIGLARVSVAAARFWLDNSL
jgi:hypothetical protein